MYVMVDEAAAEAQFERAYRASWPSVYRFALAWTNDREEAMDAAQETYRRLWEMRARYDLSVDLTPLALTVERRLLADRWRRIVRRTKAITRLIPAERSWSSTTSDRWLDVQSAMAQLSALERVALLGLALEDRSPDEMATTLGVSAGAVRAAASRGRSKLSREAQ